MHINTWLLTAWGFLHLGGLSAEMYCLSSHQQGRLAKHVFSWAQIHYGLLSGNMERLVHDSGVVCLSGKNKTLSRNLTRSVECMKLEIYRSSPLQDLS